MIDLATYRALEDNGWVHLPMPGMPATWCHPEIDNTKFWPDDYALVVNGIINLRKQDGLPIPTIEELESLFMMGRYAPDSELEDV